MGADGGCGRWVRTAGEPGEPDELWNEAVHLPARVMPSNGDRVGEALRAGYATSREIAAFNGIHPYSAVNSILLRFVETGIATRERVQREGKEYRYTLVEVDQSAPGAGA
jgi:hypothetical protein